MDDKQIRDYLGAMKYAALIVIEYARMAVVDLCHVLVGIYEQKEKPTTKPTKYAN